MAKRLFLIDNEVARGLGQTILDALKDEITDIFSFVPLSISWVAANALPEKIDFTDAIVIVVPHDDDVESTALAAQMQQLTSITAELKKLTLPNRIVLPPVTKSAAKPDQGGLGWNVKQVLPAGRTKVAICQLGGVVSCQTSKDAVLKFFAPDHLTLEEARDRKAMQRARSSTDHGQHKIDADAKADEELANAEKYWNLSTAPFRSWPADRQKAMGQALARLAAHEARHQYVIAHHDPGGLGGEAAEVFGVKRSERFLDDDKATIRTGIVHLAAVQASASVHVATFPNAQPFALHRSGGPAVRIG
jgi:hypothetical protein